MTSSRSTPSSPVDAVQAIFLALEPLDEQTRNRVVASALSLLGMTAPVGGAPIPRGVRVPPSTDARRPERLLSPVELLQEKKPASIPQKIALFAYYRERYEGQGRFSRSDLKAYFRKAKEPAPTNYDRDFTKTVRLGWIHEDGEESYLTSKGLEVTEAGFSGKALPRGRAVKKRRAKPKKARPKAAKKRSTR